MQLAIRTLRRYRKTPEFISLTVDAKDRDIVAVGEVLDVSTRAFLTTEGDKLDKRWQVISNKEMTAGHTYVLKLQTFDLFGRFGWLMADGTPTYLSATEEQKSKGAFMAGDDGLLSDGSEGYKLQ